MTNNNATADERGAISLSQRDSVKTHFLKHRWKYVLSLLISVSLLWVLTRWISHVAGHLEMVSAEDPEKIVSRDQVEIAFANAMKQNLNDFNMWYKSNIVIQSITILSGILSTIVASLATQEKAVIFRRSVIVLTAVTTALIAVQSTFHIKDNLDTFIKANSDLAVSEFDYSFKKDSALFNADKEKIAALSLQRDALTSLVRVVESRMRAYSTIGAQQARGASADVVRADGAASTSSIVAPAAPMTSSNTQEIALPSEMKK